MIGGKRTCAIKWISAVSEAELCRMFLLRGTHWNSMGTLVIREGAWWRRSVTLLLFSIYFYLTGNKFVFIKCISLSTLCSTERSNSCKGDSQIFKKSVKTMWQCIDTKTKKKTLINTEAFTWKHQCPNSSWPLSGQHVCLWDMTYKAPDHRKYLHWQGIGALCTVWQSVTLMRAFMFPAESRMLTHSHPHWLPYRTIYFWQFGSLFFLPIFYQQ